LGWRFEVGLGLGRRFEAELALASEEWDDLASLGPAPKPNQFIGQLLSFCCDGEGVRFGGALGWSSGMGIFDRWMMIVCGGLYSFFLELTSENLVKGY
jgi:hypothetical protein